MRRTTDVRGIGTALPLLTAGALRTARTLGASRAPGALGAPVTVGAAVALGAAVVLGAALPAVAQTYAIRGGTVHTLAGEPFVGTVVIRDGRIAAAGPDVEAPAGAEAVDATGRHVYPGLFDAVSRLGLTEIGAVSETNDAREQGGFNPHLQAATAIHPASEHIPVARANGIAATLSVPQGGAIAGQASLVGLDGWTVEEMLIDPGAAMVVNYPSLAGGFGNRGDWSERQERYDEAVRAFGREDEGDDPPDLRIDDADRRRGVAVAAYHLLRWFHRVPGSDDRGVVDAARLHGWLDDVRALCAQHGRVVVGDLRIGDLLSRAHPDDDGRWPCRAVCEALERISSAEVENGFIIGTNNARGVVTRQIGEMGDQERELAVKYRRWAQQIAYEFPRAGGILERIAAGYDDDASRRDTNGSLQRRFPNW